MCLLLEIGMLVMGVVTLIKGRVALSRARIVTGAPAYIIGALLILPIPLLIGLGMILSVLLISQGIGPEEVAREAARRFGFLDLVIVVGVAVICFILGLCYGVDEATVAARRKPAEEEDPAPDWIDAEERS